MTRSAIKAVVEALCEEHGTRDPFALCRALNIEIVYVPLTEHVRAFFQNIDGVNIIYLSDSLSETEQVVVLAHELGHCVLHRSLNFFFISTQTLFFTEKYEHEADEFARGLLRDNDIDLQAAHESIRKILLA